jgi:hypothetical protein
MDVPITLGLILTFILPFINAGIQKVTWSPTQKNLLAIATSAIFAIIYLVLTGGLDWSNVPLAIAGIYGLQQAIYAFFVKNIATKFEAITSPGSVVVAPSAEPGKVDITSDATIEDSKSGSSVEVDPPVQLVTSSTEAPATPVEITKDDNVAG